MYVCDVRHLQRIREIGILTQAQIAYYTHINIIYAAAVEENIRAHVWNRM